MIQKRMFPTSHFNFGTDHGCELNVNNFNSIFPSLNTYINIPHLIIIIVKYTIKLITTYKIYTISIPTKNKSLYKLHMFPDVHPKEKEVQTNTLS